MLVALAMEVFYIKIFLIFKSLKFKKMRKLNKLK